MGSAESFDAEDEFPMMSVKWEMERWRDGGDGVLSLFFFQSPLTETVCVSPLLSCVPHEQPRRGKKSTDCQF